MSKQVYISADYDEANGRELPEKRNPILVEILEAFIHFVKLHYKMIIAVVESKNRTNRESSGFRKNDKL